VGDHGAFLRSRKAPKRFAFNAFNRLVFASLYRVAPYVLNALVIAKPETVIRMWDFVCSGNGDRDSDLKCCSKFAN
jgi:hypothetical protein